MKNYLFRIDIDVENICFVNEFIIVPALTKKEACRRIRAIMLTWWGTPSDQDFASMEWIIEGQDSSYMAYIKADPNYLGILTNQETRFILRKGIAHLLKHEEIDDETIIAELKEANLKLDSGMLATLFGEALAARAILELT